MTHSYRHTKIFGVAGCKSSKWYKKWNHHRERARVKQAIKHGNYDVLDTELSPWNAWSDPRDGKVYRENFYPKRGFGIQEESRWPIWSIYYHLYTSKKYWDDEFRKAMRK